MYAAFALELQGASSTGVSILILAAPAQGMVLSKSLYRFAGTIVGALAALILTAMFPQDRTMLLASFAVFMAAQTALGSVLRDFRSYGCILAGYTVAIISIANIDAPEATFMAAVNRVAAIFIAIAAIAATNMLLATAESSKSLMTKLREATRDVLDLAEKALDSHCRPTPEACVALAARLMPLRGEISFATPERPNGRARAMGGRGTLLALFEMISVIQAVGGGLQRIGPPSPLIERAIAIGRAALRRQNPEACVEELTRLTMPALASGTLTMDEAYLLDRLQFMLQTLANLRDGLRSVRFGWRPRRIAAVPVHQDWFAVALNAVRVLVAIALVAFLGIWSGLSETATAILYTAVFVSLGGVQTDPTVMGRTALYGMPLVAVAGSVYAFFVFPFIDGYPLFILSLAPLVVATCWLVKMGMPGAGMIFGVQTFVLISPSNVQVLDPNAFLNTATMLVVSGAGIFLTFRLLLPVDPAQRRLRIALAVGDSLRNALRDEGRLEQPRASLHYDRLAQFNAWLGGRAPSLARRKTMMRLVDLGNLSLAVRRAWRALDAARPCADPDLDARARKVLPALDPEETLATARAYLAAAEGQCDANGLALSHAAAALHATALITMSETRLLRHAKLLKRPFASSVVEAT